MRKRSIARYLLGGFLLFVYIGLAVFGLSSISSSHQDMGMHHEGQAPCPFVVGAQSFCSMGALDHISAWQKMLLVDIQPTLILAIAVFAVIFPVLFFVLGAPPLGYVFYKKGKPLLPLLFAQGILHPKAP